MLARLQKLGPCRAVAVLVVAALVAGCGNTASVGTKLDATKPLRIPFSADMGVPDPAIFYAVEGLLVTTNVYEGLLQFKPDTATLAPDLATKWSASADGKTYKFTLRSGVKFHDGTTMTSEAVKDSFVRFKKIGAGPSYMLADVASMETPDAQTFVVHLKRPVNAFPDYLAAPYGPKVMSPAVLKAHAADLAKKWLSSHDAGTGAYKISSWKPGRQYTLSAFNSYWGGAPQFKTVEIPIIADFSAQRLQFERGDLQLLLSAVPKADAAALAKSSQVRTFVTDQKAVFELNAGDPALRTAAARNAVLGALDRQKIVDNVFGPAATVSRDFFPAHSFPVGLAPDDPKPAAAGLPKGAKLTLEYPSEGGATTARMASEIQIEMQQAGLSVTAHATPFAQLFTLADHPKRRPGLLTLITPPDTPHPDGWIRLLANSKSPVNYLACAAPGADQLMDKGLAQVDSHAADSAYAQSAAKVTQRACYLGVADIKDTIVAAKGLTGLTHDLAIPGSLRLATLKAG